MSKLVERSQTGRPYTGTADQLQIFCNNMSIVSAVLGNQLMSIPRKSAGQEKPECFAGRHTTVS